MTINCRSHNSHLPVRFQALPPFHCTKASFQLWTVCRYQFTIVNSSICSPPVSFLVISGSIFWNLREAMDYNLKSLAFGSAVGFVPHICFRYWNLNREMCVIATSYTFFSILILILRRKKSVWGFISQVNSRRSGGANELSCWFGWGNFDEHMLSCGSIMWFISIKSQALWVWKH